MDYRNTFYIKKTSLLLVLAGVLGLSPVWAGPVPESDLPADDSVTFGELENGVRYAVMPNSEPRGRVSLRLFVDAGSLQETDEERGLAHYLEHMAFNGTENFEAGSLVEYFQDLGMSFGADTNAYTGFDRTAYQIELPDNEVDSIDEGLLVLRDFAGRMLIEEEEVQAEKGVILSEMRSRDSPGFRTALEEFSFLLPESIIPERFPIGNEEVIRGATREDLLGFYEKWYRPERIAVILVGEVNPDDAAPLVEKHFADFEAKRPPFDSPDPGRVVASGVNARLHTEMEASSVRVAIQTVKPFEPRPDTSDERIRRLHRSVAMQILNRRLDVLARQEDAPFSRGAVAAYDLFDFFTNSSIELTTRPDDWERSLVVAEQELRRALIHGFQEVELDEVRSDLIRNYREAVVRAPTRNSRSLAEGLVRSFSADTVFTSPETEFELMVPALETMGVGDVLDSFRQAWEAEGRFLFITGNVDFENPEQTILALYDESRAEEVDAPEEMDAREFAYTDLGPAGQVAEETHIEDLDVHQIVFENGLRLNLKETDFSANAIRMSARIGSGKLTEPDGKRGLSVLASTTLVPGGLGEHSSDEIRRIFAGKNVSLNFAVNNDAFVFSGSTSPDDLLLQLKLLRAYLIDPGYRDEALRRARSSHEQAYRQARHTPAGVLQNDVARFLAGGDPRFGLPPEEALLALDLDDVRAWLRDPLAEGYVELTLVGDFEKEAAVDAVAATLGGLPPRQSKKPAFEEARQVSRAEDGAEETFTIASRIPNAYAAVYWAAPDMWDIERTRRLNVLARIMSDRMRVTIREEMGEAYSPSAVNNPSETYRDYGWFFGLVGVDPQRADAVLSVIVEIAEELYQNGISEEELRRAIMPLLTSLRDARRDNSYWMNSVLSSSQEYPQRLDWARHMHEDYSSITVEEIEALIGAYLDPQKGIRVQVLPEGEPEEGELLEEVFPEPLAP